MVSFQSYVNVCRSVAFVFHSVIKKVSCRTWISGWLKHQDVVQDENVYLCTIFCPQLSWKYQNSCLERVVPWRFPETSCNEYRIPSNRQWRDSIYIQKTKQTTISWLVHQVICLGSASTYSTYYTAISWFNNCYISLGLVRQVPGPQDLSNVLGWCRRVDWALGPEVGSHLLHGQWRDWSCRDLDGRTRRWNPAPEFVLWALWERMGNDEVPCEPCFGGQCETNHRA